MTRIDDRLRHAATQLRHDIERSADVEAALRSVQGTSPMPEGAVRSRRPLAAVAAVLLIVAGTVAVALNASTDTGPTVLAGGPSTTPGVDVPTTTTPPAPASPFGPDLRDPDPGQEITFDGAGPVGIGQVLETAEVRPFEAGGECGYWGPSEPSHDGEQPLTGLVAGADTPTPTVRTIMIRQNVGYRTAEGIGVGTSLTTLQRQYGAALVVARLGQGATPTEGLTASYNDVAAVRRGDRALTFYLTDDSVEVLKISDAASWGDDEGCA